MRIAIKQLEAQRKLPNRPKLSCNRLQQRSDEYQRSINTCEERIKQTAQMQRQKDEQIIMEIRAKSEQDMAYS